VDADYLSKKLKQALNAKEVRFFSSEGVVTDQREVSDNHTRLKALELAHRLRGDYPKDEPVQLASLVLKIGSGPASPAEWNEIATRERKVGELLAKRLEQDGYSGDVEEYQRWRAEAEVKVKAELAASKAPEELDNPIE